MKRRFLSLLLAAVLAVTSLDITAFAVQKENEESICAQEETETDAVAEEAEQTEQMGQTEMTNEMEAVADKELSENAAAEEEEIKTIEDARKEVFSESISNEDAVTAATEVWGDYVETEQNKETVGLLEDVGENSIDASDGETKEQTLEIEDGSVEEIQTEEVETADGTEIDEETETVDEDLTYTRISRVSRDDGTWFFPLDSKWWNSFSDWAGCTVGKCSLCGETHGCAVPSHKNHNGVDIGVPIGTPVFAAAPGKVVYTYSGKESVRGKFMIIEHPIGGTDFSYYSYYQHLNEVSVSKGTDVKAGDVIAKSGNTYGYDAHLHFGIVMAAKGTNIDSRLLAVEGKGWIRDSGYKEGGILANPSTKQPALPTGRSCLCEENLYLHCGSVTYTFDKSKVTVGTGSSGAASTLQIKGQSSPGNLNVGSRWTCTGTISSNYIINQVSGYILADNNSTVLYSKTINPNATSYSLANGEIDRALLFNMLPAGTYYYKITAQDASGKQLTLLNDKFTVTSPVPKPCNFSGQITAPADWAAFQTSTVKITATATDSYAINNFIVKLYNSDGITLLKTETAAANKSGDAYLCNYDLNLSEQKTYTVAVSAICANGREHFIDRRHFTYDATPPVISNLNVYEESGDFYCTANVSDSVTGVVNAAMVIRDEGGIEKNFDCKIVSDTVECIWSDINGLWTSGKYVITLYVQDKAGNIGYAALQDIVLAEVSSGPKRVDIVVGEEKEVNITINTLFKTEGKNQTQKTVCK